EQEFPGVRLEDVLPLVEREEMTDEAMVAYLAQTLQEPSRPRPSIETLLHAFLPARFVLHTHADAILALTNTTRGPELVRAALGPGALWIPYQRPGFALSKAIAQAAAAQPDATCAVMEKHGLITWGDTAKDAYERTIAVCTRAEQFVAQQRRGTPAAAEDVLEGHARRRLYTTLAPLLRGLAIRTAASGEVLPPSQTLEVPPGGRQILRFDDSQDVLDFLALPAAEHLPQIGPVTPDHLIHNRRTPLFVRLPSAVPQPDTGAAQSARPVSPLRLGEGIEPVLESAWRAWVDAYVRYVQFEAEAAGESVPGAMDPRPRVVLIPGVGMVTLGRDSRAARISADVYHHTIATIRAAEVVDTYTSLSERDCYGVEFWPLERYRLTLLPPERELSRRIVIVTGAASGIGRAIAIRFVQEGACVAISDLNLDGAQQLADELNATYGAGRALAHQTNVAEEADVASLFEGTVAAFGGLDILVSNAGIAPYGLLDATSLAEWQRSLDVNATGHFLVTREAIKLFKRQGVGGNIIFIATKNTMAPGKEFGAYSAAKSAQAQLARIAALEGGEFGIRVNMINPDAVFRGSTLWSPDLRRSRAEAHGTSEAGLEDYYRKRNLLGLPIYPEDVAEAAWWLATDRSRKSSGSVLTVDGGVPAAFPR
ncbi:MAG TPA: bifunctional rhamnulose-1-phosphate aldolase/short-chain dehydrogenase, partial [Chloroflexota bacterium]|nr:bifunctional rhamnulose-1-phosphate aldolase/short-chain dehydrogenase [Chloroflexota bacterium]